MSKEETIVLAFFDILGTSSLLNDGNYQTVYDYYEYMVNLCSDTHTPMVIVNRFKGKKNLGIEYNTDYLIINYELNHCFFSDTFLLWIEYDSVLSPTFGGFLEKCCIVFCEAIAIRGMIP